MRRRTDWRWPSREREAEHFLAGVAVGTVVALALGVLLWLAVRGGG